MAYRDPFTTQPTLFQKFTDDGGIAVWLKNDAGGTIDRGYVVKQKGVDTVDFVQIDDEAPMAVALDDVEDGDYGWFVIGGIAYVWNNLAAGITAGDWLRVSAAGDADKAEGVAVANAAPITMSDDPQFGQKVGVALETTTADGLVRTLIHF